jgi:glycine cleavage system T protein
MPTHTKCYNTIVFLLTFEIPEEDRVSMTEEEEKSTPNALIGEFPLASSGMAQILGRTEGSVRLFIDKDSHEVLGGHISGSHAEELARFISLAVESNAKLEDLINLIYCHPTLSEAIGEAAESVLGHSIHLIPGDVKKPEELEEYDVAVIGAGPAGYFAAIRSAQLGKKVAVIERDGVGGTCLIRGCIPTKVVLEAIKSEEEVPLPEIRERMERVVRTLENGVQRLLITNGVMLIKGEVDLSKSKLQGSLLELVVGEKAVKSKNVILATGSKPASLPGLEINHRNIIDSTDALELEIPDEMTIVGAGAIGLEFATIYKALGCKKVTVVEQAEQICPRWLDGDVAEILKREMEKHGIVFELGEGFDVKNIPGGKVLIAVGRTPNTRGLREKDIAIAANGFVQVNERYQVKLGNGEYAENVFAVGDMVGGQLLAHKGSEEGKMAASVATGEEANLLDYDQVPSVIFSNPEQASAGLNEEAARRSGRAIEIKYLQTPDKENAFKVITEKDSLKVLGISIIGHFAPYVIAEMTLAVRMGVTLKQLMKEGLTLASAREIDLSELEKAILGTPLTEVHREAGAEVSDYHGWWSPMRYTDSQEEVIALRNKAAIWDIGHMAVLEVTGEDAGEFLQYLTTNDVSRLKVGQLQYSFFLDEKARPLDDVIVYRLWGRRYFVVVNSTNREKIKRWMDEGLKTQDPRLKGQKDVHILDLYDCPEKRKRVTLFSIQGPEAENILSELTSFDLDTIEYFRCRKIDLAGKRMLVQRGGYSGEEGFEIFVPVHHAVDLWRKILSVGEKYGLEPAGLIARDIARQEASLPLYGNEWPEIGPYDSGQSEFPLYITPYEGNSGWAVKTNKGDFIGKEAYVKHLNDIKQGKTERYTKAGIELAGRWNLYKSSKVFIEDQEAGIATSGRFSHYLGKSIFLAYVKEDLAELGVAVAVEIGQDRIAGKIVPTPFVNNITYPHRGDAKENARYYITLNDDQIDKMLHDIIDADSIDEICHDLRDADQPLPEFGLPQGLSRRKNYYHHSHLARINYSLREYSSFLGAGSYDYEIPDVVNWAASLRGLYTPYTPYQAEVAQGLLRFFYVYQSQICQLTGMEVANASLYDGATALAEAAFMSVRITDTPDEPRSMFLVANPLHPFYYQVLETYARDVGCKVLQAPFDEKKGTVDLAALRDMIDRSVACVIVQQPNFFGQIEGELQEVAVHTHDSGALLVSCATDPHSLEILEAPGYYGADIAVGEIQAFGNPVNGGGPNSGFLATSEQYLREVPGRIGKPVNSTYRGSRPNQIYAPILPSARRAPLYTCWLKAGRGCMRSTEIPWL